jgi:hypothetical protein
MYLNESYIATVRKLDGSSNVEISIEVAGNKTSGACKITILYTKTTD